MLVFRFRPRVIAKHVGVLGSGYEAANRPGPVPAGAFGPAPPRLTLIHAVEGVPVSEVPLLGWWQRRIAAAFSFPGIID